MAIMDKDEILRLMTAMIRANGVQVFRLGSGGEIPEDLDYGLRVRLFPSYDYAGLVSDMVSRSSSDALVYLEDEFGAFYSVLSIEDGQVFLLGPMLFKAPDIDKVISGNAFPEGYAGSLREYYNRVPVIPSLDMWNNMLCTFLNGLDARGIPRVLLNKGRIRTLPQAIPADPGTEDNEFAYKLVEKRYERENEFLKAVSAGDADKALEAYREFLGFRLSPRTPDVLRDKKNFAVILNTLLRKTCEQSSVHPFLLDGISRDFALKIESALSSDYVDLLFRRMVVAYCGLVKEYSHKGLSPVVREAVSYIDANYPRRITLSVLAGILSVRPGYLSRAFSKEMGETVTSYINRTRVRASQRLLADSSLSIMQIALECGFSGQVYYARVFRALLGTSPHEYRESLRG